MKLSIIFTLLALPLSLLADSQSETERVFTPEELRQKLLLIQESEENTSAWSEAVITVFFDNKNKGELLAHVYPDDRLPSVQYSKLRGYILGSVPDALIEQLGESQDVHGWVPLDGLKEYSVAYKPEALAVVLTTPAARKKNTDIDLSGLIEPDATGAIPMAKTSFYTNLHNQIASVSGLTYKLEMESAFRRRNWIVEAISSWSPQEKEKRFSYRGLKLIRDYPNTGRRLILGETNSFHTNLITSERIQGLKYGTESEIRPRDNATNTSEYSFLLDRDSTVELYVNNELRQTMRLGAGPYDLRNFPLRIGVNNIELRIVNDLGSKQTLRFNAVSGPNLLKLDKSQFQASFGVLGSGEVFTRTPVFGAYYKRGLSDSVSTTLGLSASNKSLLTAVGADFVTPWFYGSAEMAASFSRFQGGAAVLLGIGRSFENCSLYGRYEHRDIRYITLVNEIAGGGIDHSADISLNFPSLGKLGGLRFSVSHMERYSGQQTTSELVEWSKGFGPNWRLSANAEYNHQDNPGLSALVRLSYRQGTEKLTRTHDMSLSSERQSVTSALSGPEIGKAPIAWRVTHQYDSTKDTGHTQAINASGFYEGNRFVGYYRADLSNITHNAKGSQGLALSTSIAYADGNWAFGRPIQGAFALVAGADSTEHKILQARGSGVVCMATGKMPAVLPNLRAYSPSCLQVTPYVGDMELDTEVYTVVPQYKSGYLIQMASSLADTGEYGAKGRLLTASKVPIGLRYITVQGKGLAVPSFTNADGSFFVSGLAKNIEYKVTVDQADLAEKGAKEPSVLFTIPKEAAPNSESDVGELILKMAGEVSFFERNTAKSPLLAFEEKPAEKETYLGSFRQELSGLATTEALLAKCKRPKVSERETIDLKHYDLGLQRFKGRKQGTVVEGAYLP